MQFNLSSALFFTDIYGQLNNFASFIRDNLDLLDHCEYFPQDKHFKRKEEKKRKKQAKTTPAKTKTNPILPLLDV